MACEYETTRTSSGLYRHYCREHRRLFFTYEPVLEQDCRPLNEAATPPSSAPAAPEAETPPGLGARVGKYGRALHRWIVAGRPVRDEAEVQRIFETLCRPCEHFDAQKEICKTCGCRVRQSGGALVNKIRMGTERCPRGKW